MIEDPRSWPIIATISCYVYSLLFWYFFFNRFAWHTLGIGMGLGGALYPVFFTVPVLVGVLIYEFGVQTVLRGRSVSTSMRLFLTLWLPFSLISFLLVLFCPMDSQYSFLEAFIRKFTR